MKCCHNKQQHRNEQGKPVLSVEDVSLSRNCKFGCENGPREISTARTAHEISGLVKQIKVPEFQSAIGKTE